MKYPVINGEKCTDIYGVRAIIFKRVGRTLTNKSIYSYIYKGKLPKALPFRVAGRAYWSVQAVTDGCKNLIVAV